MNVRIWSAVWITTFASSMLCGKSPAAETPGDKPVLYVSFTMDCERPHGEERVSYIGGPLTPALSERAIRGYCETLLDANIRPTLFVVPETAAHHSELLKQLAGRGVEMGMHLHPQQFRDRRYTKYLGEYDAAMQKTILGEGAADVEKALGIRPRAFRPGNFSANDQTFGVLVELGFTHGSVSDPGRSVPDYHAVWQDAEPDAHWANSQDRLVSGMLPFFEAPLTTDPAQRHANGFPYELRIEDGDFESWHLPILTHALEGMERRQTAFRVVSIFTHNYFGYDQPESVHSRRLSGYIGYIRELRQRYDVRPLTLEEIRQEFAKPAERQKDR